MLSVTLNGQLFLLMLIEDLYVHGIKTFYANTDGITAIVDHDKEELYYEICQKWQTYTKLKLEFEEIDTFYHRDCNNYILQTKKGKVKAKGAYDWKKYCEKYGVFDVSGSFNCPIVPYAVQKHLLDGVPCEETIRNHRDIIDFTIARKIGKQYNPVLVNGLTGEMEELQQAVRYYIAHTPYKLIKKKSEKQYVNDLFGEKFITKKRNHDASRNYNVQILNDIVYYDDFSQYKINYEYYIKECYKLIDPLYKNTQQMTLFDVI